MLDGPIDKQVASVNAEVSRSRRIYFQSIGIAPLFALALTKVQPIRSNLTPKIVKACQ